MATTCLAKDMFCVWKRRTACFESSPHADGAFEIFYFRVYGPFPALGKENLSPQKSKDVAGILSNEKIIVAQVLGILEELDWDDLSQILDYYKKDFKIGGYTYTER